MDITPALAPHSDQLDAIELVDPRTFTIDTGSRLGKRDGKTVAEIRLVGFDRVWRPSKGMLDVLAACWGSDAKAWVGRRVTVYNDPDVMYGKERRGGVRISHLSHIEGPRDVQIRSAGTDGRKRMWPVQPLADAPAPAPSRDWTAELKLAGDDLDAVASLGKAAASSGADSSVLKQMSDKWQQLNAAAKEAMQG